MRKLKDESGGVRQPAKAHGKECNPERNGLHGFSREGASPKDQAKQLSATGTGSREHNGRAMHNPKSRVLKAFRFA